MMISLALSLLLAAAPADFNQYLDEIRKRVESRWKYPPKSENLQATVKFSLDRAARVSELRIIKSSGRDAFDASVLEAVREATPFPPLLLILKKSEVRDVEMTFKRKAVVVGESKPPSSKSVPKRPTDKRSASRLKKPHRLRCAQSPRCNVPVKYASARRFLARLASESF